MRTFMELERKYYYYVFPHFYLLFLYQSGNCKEKFCKEYHQK